MNQDNVQLIEQAFTLETSHEIDKVLELFTHDAEFEDVPLNLVANGHDEIRNLFETMFVAMPDFTMTSVSIVADENSGSAEWIQSGTFVGDFGDLKATGKRFAVRGGAMVRFANGRISKWTDYWSKSTFEEQVGLA
jgi:steroid delta-isomerase-like uncharacterized protein